MKEEWKDIEGYEGLYQVSNTGKVKSLGNGKSTNKDNCRERILKASTNNSGYQYVGLSKEGKNNRYAVHRLVATAFLENPKNLPVVNHKNEVKTDNCVQNLEWCSRSYNLTYNGRAKKVAEKIAEKVSEKLKGRKFSEEHKKKLSESRKRKPVYSINKKSGLIIYWESIKEAEKQTGIDNSSIIRCCKGRQKSAGGFYWHYVDDKEACNGQE